VVWLGHLIGRLERLVPAAGTRAGGPLRQLCGGAALVGTTLAAAVLPALAVDRLARRLPVPVGVCLAALALKPAFAWQSLDEHVARVAAPLARGDLTGARAALAMIVSRRTKTLDAPRIAAAAIESLAENTSDSVVAPLFWYAVAGLPGAWLYRAANTMDAMIGYRTPRYEWLGKPAARLDDVLNWMPARLTAALVAAGTLERGAAAWGLARREHGATASPNAGWPMAAMAGALGVELEKTGHYRLGAGQRLPHAGDVQRARRIAAIAAAAAVGLAGVATGVRSALRWQ
jgi:adenosylcobinamide-phosphate synthase